MGPEFAALVARSAHGEKLDVTAECARVGVSRKTFYKYLARFAEEGIEGFYPRSRRPLSSPSRVTAEVEDLIVRVRKELDDDGWDAGAEQIAFWIGDHPDAWPAGKVVPSRATINRILERRGQIVQVPQRRPHRSLRRFEAAQPNTMWQMDGFEFDLVPGQLLDLRRRHCALPTETSVKLSIAPDLRRGARGIRRRFRRRPTGIPVPCAVRGG